jgi:hypothetical protein
VAIKIEFKLSDSYSELRARLRMNALMLFSSLVSLVGLLSFFGVLFKYTESIFFRSPLAAGSNITHPPPVMPPHFPQPDEASNRHLNPLFVVSDPPMAGDVTASPSLSFQPASAGHNVIAQSNEASAHHSTETETSIDESPFSFQQVSSGHSTDIYAPDASFSSPQVPGNVPQESVVAFPDPAGGVDGNSHSRSSSAPTTARPSLPEGLFSSPQDNGVETLTLNKDDISYVSFITKVLGKRTEQKNSPLTSFSSTESPSSKDGITDYIGNPMHFLSSPRFVERRRSRMSEDDEQNT